jgi:hypothetical protein
VQTTKAKQEDKMRIELRNFVLGGLLGIGSLYTLAAVSVPNTFTTGTSIKAAEMNNNFAALTTGINALETSKQTRVTGTCTANQAIKEIKADGTVTCEAVGAGGLSSVAANSSLTGNGTTAVPLGIANNAITAPMLKTSSAPSGTKFLSYNGTGLAWADSPAFSFGQSITGGGQDGLVIRNTGDGSYLGLLVTSSEGNAIVGQSPTGMIGVQGSGGAGVQGTGTQIGVIATGPVGVAATGTTAAIELNGAIKVTGQNKAAFVHTVTTTTNLESCIDNPMSNNDPNAIVMFTHRLTQRNPIFYNTPAAVYYNTQQQQWCITSENATNMVTGKQFNILVIKQ